MLASEILRSMAVEADRLADECANGTAPPLIADDFGTLEGPHCAIGEVLARVGKCAPWEFYHRMHEAIPYGTIGTEAAHIASRDLRIANNTASDETRHSAVIQPLRRLAVALRGIDLKLLSESQP